MKFPDPVINQQLYGMFGVGFEHRSIHFNIGIPVIFSIPIVFQTHPVIPSGFGDVVWTP